MSRPDEIRDLDGRHDRFVRDVLEPLEFQFDLDLGLRRRGQKNSATS